MAKTISSTPANRDLDEPEIDYSDYELLLPAEDGLPPVYTVTPEQGRRLFDEAVRRQMGISGDEFIQRWEAGELANIPDDEEHRHLIELALLMPLAQQGA